MTAGNEDIKIVTIEDDSIANAVGAGPVTTIEVDGKEYELAPMKMKDLAQVEKHAKSTIRKEALATIREAGDLLDPDQIRQTVLELATEGMSWIDFLSSPSGIEYVIILRLRRSYPEMSEGEARELVTVQAVRECTAEVAELVGLDVFADMVDGDASPNVESG